MPIDASSDPYDLPGFDPATKGGADLDDDLADLDDAGSGAAGRSGALEADDDDLGGGGKLGATVEAGTEEGAPSTGADKFAETDDDGLGDDDPALDEAGDALGSLDAGGKGDDLDDLDDAGSGAKGDLGLDDGGDGTDAADADLGKTSLDVDDDPLSPKFGDDGTDGLDSELGTRAGFDLNGDDDGADLKDFGDDDVDDPSDAGDLGDALHDLF